MTRPRPSHALASVFAVIATLSGACAQEAPTSDPPPELVSTHRPPSNPTTSPMFPSRAPSGDDTNIGLRDRVTITVSD